MCDWMKHMTEAMTNEISQSPAVNWFTQRYFWPMRNGKPKSNAQDELKTIKTFADLSEKLLKLLTQEHPDRESLVKYVKDIVVKWGGVRSAPVDTFVDKIQECNNKIKNETFEIRECCITEILNLVKNQNSSDATNKYRIPSWSKILAALAPGKLFIYDSRVALALSYFCLKNNISCFWRIPKGNEVAEEYRRGYGNFMSKYREKNLAGDRADIPTCYFRYHQLLQELARNDTIKTAYGKLPQSIREAYNNVGIGNENDQTPAIMAHIEKMLFMMKEDILCLYQ